MPQNLAAAIPTTQSNPTTIEYLNALGGLVYPVTALLMLITIVFIVAAVGFGWFEINASWDKFSLRVQRPQPIQPTPAIVSHPAPMIEGAAEDPGPANGPQDVAAQAVAPAPDQQGEQEPNIFMYISARTLDDLDRTYGPFAAALAPEDVEFWETNYRQRRAMLGADNGREAVRQLTTDHPTWAYPHAVMLEWSLADHDAKAAEGYLAAGLTRQTSPQFGHVLSAGVKFHYELYGALNATIFCAEWSISSIPERIKASAFYTLAELLKQSGDDEGQRIALEWAVAIYPSSTRNTFALAYSYGESPGRWSSAMWHYQRIVGKEDDGVIARNNLGVLLAHFDKRAQIESYEKAAEHGDVYAVANIAHLLIADGYSKAAERLLASVTEPGAAAELHGTAAAAAMAARRNLHDRETEIVAAVGRESEAYRRSLAKALRYVQSTAPTATGSYVSADALTVVTVDDKRALCRVRAGFTDYEGTLNHQGTCYAGHIISPGQTLLGSFVHQVTLLNEGGGTLRLFRWPNATGEAFKTIETELQRVDVAPPPLPPIVLPAPLSGTGLGLLGLGQPRSN